MYWLNESKGILAGCEQLDKDGNQQPGQEQVEDDDPRVLTMMQPPEPKPDPNPIDAKVADLQRQIDELNAKLSAKG